MRFILPITSYIFFALIIIGFNLGPPRRILAEASPAPALAPEPAFAELAAQISLALVRARELNEPLNEAPRSPDTPASPEVVYLLEGFRAYQANDQAEALRCWQALAGIKPDDYRPFFLLARAYWQQGQPQAAAGQWRRSLELNRDSSPSGRLDWAADQLAEAAWPDGPDLSRLEEVWLIRRNILGAADLLTVSAALKLADLLEENGQPEEAERHWQEIWLLSQKQLIPGQHPFVKKATLNLAALYSRQGRTASLERLLTPSGAKPAAFKRPVRARQATLENQLDWLETALQLERLGSAKLAKEMAELILTGPAAAESAPLETVMAARALKARLLLAEGDQVGGRAELRRLAQLLTDAKLFPDQGGGPGPHNLSAHNGEIAQAWATLAALEEQPQNRLLALRQALAWGRPLTGSSPFDFDRYLELAHQLSSLQMERGLREEAYQELLAALQLWPAAKAGRGLQGPRVYFRLAQLAPPSLARGYYQKSAQAARNFWPPQNLSFDQAQEIQIILSQSLAALGRPREAAVIRNASLAALSAEASANEPASGTPHPAPECFQLELKALTVLGRLEDIRTPLEEALSWSYGHHGPDSAVYWAYFGVWLNLTEAAGRAEEVASILGRIIERPAGSTEERRQRIRARAWRQLGEYSFTRGRLKEAAKQYQKAARIMETLPGPVDPQLAEIRQKLDRLKPAR